MHFHQICKCTSYSKYTVDTHVKHMALNCVNWFFSLPLDVCIDVNFNLTYVTIGSYMISRACQPICNC